MKERFQVGVAGHVLVRDAITNQILVDKNNAIHPQNMALVIARSLSRDTLTTPGIFSMAFGNGGTFFNSSGVLIYRPPNTVGSATLYNQTYSVQVDDQSAGTPATNSVTFAQSTSPAITSIVTVIAQLSAGEPSGQSSADNINVNPNAPYMFDEIGLKSSDGLLLSHIVFNPFEKTANRAFLITYTLTISVS
jgi:hypothetical protein